MSGDSLRHTLKRMSTEGVLFSVMVGAGEAYLAPFALAIGASPVWAALLVTVPLVAGGILQLISPVAVRRLGSRRRWVAACATAQSLSFIPLVAAALTGSGSILLVYLMATTYWATGMATGPAWNAWVGTLVPKRIRTGYFAGRTGLINVGVATGLLGGGALLQAAASREMLLTGFAVLFGAAALARGASAIALWRQPEPGVPHREDRVVSVRTLSLRFRGSAEGRLLRYLLVFTLSVAVASPFFTPFMLRHLGLSHAQYTVLLATSLAARVFAAPLAGRFARRFGVARLLRLSALGIVPLAGLWSIDGGFSYLLVLQVLSGAMWASHELAAFLMFFDTIDEHDRTAILTFYNLGHAVALLVGSLVGAFVFLQIGNDARAYATLFIGSSCLRALSALLLSRVPGTALPRVGLVLRTLAVRPGWGSITRPIISTIDERRRPRHESSDER